MADLLKSDLGLTQEHSSNLLSASINLSELPEVSEGSTNHDVNKECMNAYQGIKESLERYLEGASRDAGRIQTLGLHFADVDYEQAAGMGGTD